MSDLPRDRLSESPPFTYCGMDAFGPIQVTEGTTTRRTNSEKKVWGLLFTCLVTRAVHVEPLPFMDTPTFRNALRRFFSIRGVCQLIRSDQGTNFMGARNEDLSIQDINSEIEQHHCRWEINPPHASHFGGVWERKIGSIRRILEACILEISPRKLSRDELHTFLQEAVAIINNTPMWEISNDVNDPYPLTPASLLTLKDNPNPPPLDTFSKQDILAYGRRRHRRIQYLTDQFWNRWRNEYIHDLQPRRKWLTEKRSVKIGDLVMLRDKNLKRNHWPLARVTDVKISDDNLVRSVTVTVPSKNGTPHTYNRPISNIILLLESE